MKIDILFRGPVRPDYQDVYNNIRMLADSFNGFDVNFYIFSWKSEEANKLLSFCNKLFLTENVILQEELAEEFILHTLARMQISPLITWHLNAFKQFWSMKTAMSSFVFKGDFVIYSRIDMRVKLNSNDKNLFDKDKYSTFHIHDNNGGTTNDQFGIATPNVMKKAWDYHNFNLLGKLLNTSAYPPEITLNKIMKNNGVKGKVVIPEIWYLPGCRHSHISESSSKQELYYNTIGIDYNNLLKKYKINL